VRQLLEVVRARHEVRLAVDLHQHADASAAVDVALDETLRRGAVDALGSAGDALLGQEVHGLADVAVRRLQGALAVHYACAGFFAQFFDLVRGDRQCFPLLLIEAGLLKPPP
jgi:hypothetical protein